MEGDCSVDQEVGRGNIKMGIKLCEEVGTESCRITGFVLTIRVLLPDS
jgi:hypothetical protein